MNMTKKKIIIITIMAAMCCAVAALVSVTYGGKVKPDSDGAELYVDRDDTADSVRVMVAEHLTALGKAGWKCLGAFTGRSFSPKTGHYVLREGDNVIDVYKMLSRGHQTPVKLVVRSVRTPELLAGRLAGQLMADSTEIMRCLSDSAVCASYGFEPHTVIAMFLENSYEVYWNMSVRGLFDRMKREYDAYWDDARRKKASSMGLTPIEVMTLASIVDEETAKTDEKPMVAGLYLNRLKRGMLLQADPTAKFASGNFSARRIYNSHLSIDSPYNTYIYPGLPPGPIRLPSRSGVESVLNYAVHDYIYMCAKEDFSGYHNFASTYSRHLANARKYRRELNHRGIK